MTHAQPALRSDVRGNEKLREVNFSQVDERVVSH